MKSKLSQDDAETIAFQALSYLTQEAGLIGKFLAESGFGPQELKIHLSEPTFLGGLLDFFLGHGDLLLRFANDSQLNPQDIVLARLHFPGAPQELTLG
jgi:uncharacterized protein DUF3572